MAEQPPRENLQDPRRRQRADAAPLDRVPPHSLEAERGVLGCMLLDPVESIGHCLEKLKRGSQSFYDLRHQELYDLLVEMYDQKEGIDVITVRQKLKDAGKLEALGGIEFVTSLQEATPSPLNLPFYLEIVREKHLLRRMVWTCTQVVERVFDPEQTSDVEGLLDEVEKDVLQISEDRDDEADKGIKDLVHGAISQIETFHQQQGMTTGVASGFADLDKMTTGMHGAEMIVVAARPSMGKTSLAMNIAEHVAIDSMKPVGVFSLEMSAESLILRMLCSRAKVNLRNVREGFLAERDFPKLTTAASKMSKAPLFIDDSAGLSILQLRAKARRMWQQHKIELFVIDYLQLLRSTATRADNRQQEIADISNGIKALAKELNVPVIVLAQLNRELEKRESGAAPKLSDLRESGAIEQDADLVCMLYRPKMQDDGNDAPGDYDGVPVNLLIAKQRNGPTGDVPLTFLKGYTRFESVSRVSEGA
ncbi:MAG: replicative DNA helicase [Verrucomicrobiales bacterium]|nr:replicative DNA helicase [Verrucomicrobiales bacterium]